MKKRSLQTLGCILLLHLFSFGAWAQTPIKAIVIEGNHAVSEVKIRRVLKIQEGDTYDAQAVTEAIRRLFATREFSDIKVFQEAEPDGVILTFVVVEHIRIDILRLEGNKHLKDDEVLDKLNARSGAFIRPSVLREDFQTIEDLYRDKGYYRAKVEHKVTTERDKETNKASTVLIYEVTEGEKVSIKHVDFFGNRSLDSDEIRGVMESKEDRWFRGGDFKPNTLDTDLERIAKLFRDKGFLDARVVDKELVFSDNGKALDVFITVEEGKRYRVGKVTWSGNTIFTDQQIGRQVTFTEGAVFGDQEFADIQNNITVMYADRGYIYNSVSPEKTLRGNVIDVHLDITEGNPAHIREINIAGNTKTTERVIRRELTVHPGEVFRRPKLLRSMREVFNLGFFEGPPVPDVKTANDEGDIDITLRVKEKQTGQFRLGAGFSALNSISGFFGLAETNFLGRGQQVGVDWEFSRYRQNIDLRFTEPWLFGTPTQLSVNLFNRSQNQVRQQFYDDRRRGASLSIGRPFPWFDYTSVFWRYRWERIQLKNFSPSYTGPLRDIFTPIDPATGERSEKPQDTSTTSVTLLRNSTDSPFRPSSGTRASFTAEWTGGVLGGNVSFQQYEASFSWYERLFWKFVLEMSFQAAVLDGFSSPGQVPDYELFRLGGNQRWGVRGYDFYEIVPEGNAEFLGGRYMNIMKYEVTFPIAPTVFGVGFFDAGNTWNSFRGADVLDLRKGLGLGVRIELPLLGTIGFDYGYGFDKVGGAAWEPHISLGQRF